MDKRVENNKQNVINLKNLLIEISKNPSNFINDEFLINSLKSQGLLSKYENKEYGISISSLNTLKRTSEKFLDNGFEELDKLRIMALNKLQSDSNNIVPRNTKEYYQQRYLDIKEELDIQKQINLIAINEILNNINLLKNIKNIKEVSLIHNLCDKNISKLQSYALDFSDFSILKEDKKLKIVKDNKNE